MANFINKWYEKEMKIECFLKIYILKKSLKLEKVKDDKFIQGNSFLDVCILGDDSGFELYTYQTLQILYLKFVPVR